MAKTRTCLVCGRALTWLTLYVCSPLCSETRLRRYRENGSEPVEADVGRNRVQS